MLKLIAIVASVAVTVAASTAASAQTPAVDSPCVEVSLRDEQNQPIDTSEPVIAFMVGQRPIIDGAVPRYAALVPGTHAVCPKALIVSVRETYEQACLTAERRAQTAEQFKTNVKAVNEDCRVIGAALSHVDGAR
jgi:hypothetical protein